MQVSTLDTAPALLLEKQKTALRLSPSLQELMYLLPAAVGKWYRILVWEVAAGRFKIKSPEMTVIAHAQYAWLNYSPQCRHIQSVKIPKHSCFQLEVLVHSLSFNTGWRII